MFDYRENYFRLLRASEQALRILITAQKACEEAILSEGEELGELRRLQPEDFAPEE